MFFLFGLRLFGATDSVSAGRGENKKPLFHVATQFFHINFVPLCPFTSYLVLDFLPGSQRRCVKIPLSCKSIGIAWLRFLSWLAVLIFGSIVLAGIINLSNLNNRDPFPWESVPCLIVASGFASFVTWHSFFSDASRGRAMELLTQMDLGERFDATFRRMVEESFSSQQCVVGEAEYSALARTIPTATAELVDGGIRAEAGMHVSRISNDLELSEVSGENDVPTAVAVTQPAPRHSSTIQTAKIVDQTKRRDGIDFENGSQFSIV